MTSYLINRYIKDTSRIERADVPKDAISQRYFYTLSVPEKYRVEVALINRLIREFVIDSPQVRTLEEKGKHIIRCLFRNSWMGTMQNICYQMTGKDIYRTTVRRRTKLE